MVGALLSVGLVMAACSSGSSSSTTTTGGSGSQSIGAAQSAVATLEQRPTQLETTIPITKAIPTGKTIDWIQCSIADCTILTPSLQAAAAKLGWKVNVIDGGITPETIKNAWDIAVRDHPDVVMATGFPKVVFQSELAQLQAANIPVIDGFVSDTSRGGITAAIKGNNPANKIGNAMANWVLSAKGTSANTLLVTSSTFSTLENVVSGFKSVYSNLCSKCPLGVLDEPATTFGTTLPGDVVGYLRTHPSVNYVVADEGAIAMGLPQALASAGMSNVAVVGQYPSATTASYLQDGTYLKSIIMPQEIDSMWQMVDAAARFFTGMSVTPSEAPSPLWAVTPKTVSQLVSPYYLIPSYQSKYAQVWGVK